MDALLQLGLTVAVAFAYAVAVRPVLRTRARLGAVTACCAAIGVLFCPLLIPHDEVVLRALALLACTELMFKMFDYSRESRCRVLSAGEYYRFLIPFPPFLVVLRDRDRRLPRVSARDLEIFRVVMGASLFATGFVLVHLVNGIPAVRSCFALDHAIKLLIFVVTIESLSQMFYGIERLAGYDTTPPMQYAFLSRTVAEFWCRYNNRVHVWFDYNVFRPLGGRRAPLRGILLVFLVSGIHHELGFAIATSRINGYQFMFFLLQAPAVACSRKLQRFSRRSGPMGITIVYGLTVIWLYFTSMFFFHGVNRIFPFFYAGTPWLP
jgi:hypothetical protein